MTRGAPARVAFRFEGELEDVPPDAAAVLAGVARALLRHSDEHDGAPATMRLARVGPLLNLWLTDPACSPACLRGSGCVPAAPDPPEAPHPGGAGVSLDAGPVEGDAGLRLHWVLALGELPAQVRPVAS